MPIREPNDNAIIAAYVAAQLTDALGSEVTLTSVQNPHAYRGPAFKVTAGGGQSVQQRLEDIVAEYTSETSVNKLGMNSRLMGHFARCFNPLTIQLDELTALRVETVRAIQDKDAPG